uniref:Retroviral polymerase SH3-like domain-containing protein n=1 Tax=Trichogramma kaykai TaxID=54128 RepID=A0ABD2XSG7_9HYME
MNKSRCLLDEAKIEKKYWPEIVCVATYLKNRTITNSVQKETPYEIFFGKKPDVPNLKLYGSKVFVRTPEVKRKSKWDKKAEIGILVGYENNGYRVLLNGRIIVTRNIEILNSNEKCIGIKNHEDDNNKNSFKSLSESENDEHKNVNFDLKLEKVEKKERIENETKEDEMTPLRRSTRSKSVPNRYDSQAYNSCIFANSCRTDIPHTFEEAINAKDSAN